MGLDMFLTKETYIADKYAHRNVKAEINITIDGNKVEIDPNKIREIVEEVGCWRKANAIHKWFVDNVQDGEDDCKKHYVSFEKLSELKQTCENVFNKKDASFLPTEEGFFFGSTGIDDIYFQHLEDTIKIINQLDQDGEYYYQSSW